MTVTGSIQPQPAGPGLWCWTDGYNGSRPQPSVGRRSVQVPERGCRAGTPGPAGHVGLRTRPSLLRSGGGAEIRHSPYTSGTSPPVLCLSRRGAARLSAQPQRVGARKGQYGSRSSSVTHRRWKPVLLGGPAGVKCGELSPLSGARLGVAERRGGTRALPTFPDRRGRRWPRRRWASAGIPRTEER